MHPCAVALWVVISTGEAHSRCNTDTAGAAAALAATFCQVLRAEAEQLKVLSDVDAVYTEIATLRDEVRSGKAATRDALSEMLELHFQCQQLEQQNRILAERLVKTQVCSHQVFPWDAECLCSVRVIGRENI